MREDARERERERERETLVRLAHLVAYWNAGGTRDAGRKQARVAGSRLTRYRC